MNRQAWERDPKATRHTTGQGTRSLLFPRCLDTSCMGWCAGLVKADGGTEPTCKIHFLGIRSLNKSMNLCVRKWRGNGVKKTYQEGKLRSPGGSRACATLGRSSWSLPLSSSGGQESRATSRPKSPLCAAPPVTSTIRPWAAHFPEPALSHYAFTHRLLEGTKEMMNFKMCVTPNRFYTTYITSQLFLLPPNEETSGE